MAGSFELLSPSPFPTLRWRKGCGDVRPWAVAWASTCMELWRPLWVWGLTLLLLLVLRRDSSGTSQHLLKSEVQSRAGVLARQGLP